MSAVHALKPLTFLHAAVDLAVANELEVRVDGGRAARRGRVCLHLPAAEGLLLVAQRDVDLTTRGERGPLTTSIPNYRELQRA